MTQLHIDIHGASEYLSNPWSFGTNVSHASLLLERDIQRHLLMGRDELGFRHLRFQGVFDDALKVLRPDGSYDFTVVEKLFDWMMEQGFVPFVALTGVPSALKAEGSPLPADRDKWVDMVRALAAFVDGRYGCDAQEWHFEVWPGPDDPAKWPDAKEEYYRLYDLAARAVKSVNGQMKVGGPGAADADWTNAFIEHLAQPSEAFGMDGQRCDFVTVVGSSAGPADAGAIGDRVAAVRTKLTEQLGETVPLILSSWSRVAEGASIENDRCSVGSFVAAVAAATAPHIAGALYDRMSDADQAGELNYEPFHGGTGLVTVNDIRKPSFNAFKLLNEHNGYNAEWRWEEPTEGLSALVTKDYHHVIRILASYNPSEETKSPAKFAIEGLPESVQWGQVQVLRPTAGSALESWVAAGAPPFVNRHILEELETGSHPATAEVNFRDFPPRLEPGMTLQLAIPLPDDIGMTD